MTLVIAFIMGLTFFVPILAHFWINEPDSPRPPKH